MRLSIHLSWSSLSLSHTHTHTELIMTNHKSLSLSHTHTHHHYTHTHILSTHHDIHTVTHTTFVSIDWQQQLHWLIFATRPHNTHLHSLSHIYKKHIHIHKNKNKNKNKNHTYTHTHRRCSIRREAAARRQWYWSTSFLPPWAPLRQGSATRALTCSSDDPHRNKKKPKPNQTKIQTKM